MPDVSELIAALTAATDQMEDAARGEDWELVAHLQKRRRVLIESLSERLAQEPLTEDESERIETIRQQESLVAALANARLEELRQVLAEFPEVQTPRLSRMERAYRDGMG
ncbi:flagellar protein FliT [Caldichromatium japonicum]|uniref:Flagellar protein FliT n=1 Tax=Caldichromatium japonicum TaxID=2699430 RepID=A0A6G7V9U7_9GAMM|nr:flagellar protein FliT [Caldichromatium japonicum]QIK36843.1 flagellar protein FliT [Caldichromatium japonicum]